MLRALRPLGRRHRGPRQEGPRPRPLREPGVAPGARRDLVGPLPRDAQQEQDPAGEAGGALRLGGLLRRGDGGARHERLLGEFGEVSFVSFESGLSWWSLRGELGEAGLSGADVSLVTVG